MANQWFDMTAIYVIGNRYPMAIFAQEQLAAQWAESAFPGEWVSKPVKIPPLPLASKAAAKDLRSMANILERMEWSSEDDEDDPDSRVGKVIIDPQQ